MFFSRAGSRLLIILYLLRCLLSDSPGQIVLTLSMRHPDDAEAAPWLGWTSDPHRERWIVQLLLFRSNSAVSGALWGCFAPIYAWMCRWESDDLHNRTQGFAREPFCTWAVAAPLGHARVLFCGRDFWERLTRKNWPASVLSFPRWKLNFPAERQLFLREWTDVEVEFVELDLPGILNTKYK